jgi:hypothetical protein
MEAKTEDLGIRRLLYLKTRCMHVMLYGGTYDIRMKVRKRHVRKVIVRNKKVY